MPQTYSATLHGNHVVWTGDAPDPTRPVRIRVTVLDEPSEPAHRGERMAAALRKLAAAGAFAEVADPASWQRETRRDRVLPGREG